MSVARCCCGVTGDCNLSAKIVGTYSDNFSTLDTAIWSLTSGTNSSNGSQLVQTGSANLINSTFEPLNVPTSTFRLALRYYDTLANPTKYTESVSAKLPSSALSAIIYKQRSGSTQQYRFQIGTLSANPAAASSPVADSGWLTSWADGDLLSIDWFHSTNTFTGYKNGVSVYSKTVTFRSYWTDCVDYAASGEIVRIDSGVNIGSSTTHYFDDFNFELT